MVKNENQSHALHTLGIVGVMALVGFVVVFLGIPWDWSMFMDDTLYNAWMPGVTDLSSALRSEIAQYFSLGRFYPVKYIANLLKWRYLPNDPYAFRYFNFGIFLLATSLGAAAALRVNRPTLTQLGSLSLLSLFLFFLGSSVLHKPLLEIISLNPLGETWVCLFFALGSFFLFSEYWATKFLLARFCFLLVALSKEPAALVFFASAAYYGCRAWLEPQFRKKWAIQSGIDLLFFAALLAMALAVMAQGTFTKNAYFAATPWLTYSRDLAYKLMRYALWTAPFFATFFLCRQEIGKLLREKGSHLPSAAIFFALFGFSYDVFMASQGIVAYQQVPASMGYFCFFALIAAALAGSGALSKILSRYSVALLLLFSLSYFVSVSRWQRFVRGIVEPRKAMTNLIYTGYPFTVFVPRGEIYGHVQELLKQHNPTSRVFQIGDKPGGQMPQASGKIFVFEFPTYMGELPKEQLVELEQMAGGWASVTDARTYRIYVGNKTFNGNP